MIWVNSQGEHVVCAKERTLSAVDVSEDAEIADAFWREIAESREWPAHRLRVGVVVDGA